MTVLCVDARGDAVRSVRAEDVCVGFTDGDEVGWIACVDGVDDATARVRVTPVAAAARTATLVFDISSTRFEAVVQVVRPVVCIDIAYLISFVFVIAGRLYYRWDLRPHPLVRRGKEGIQGARSQPRRLCHGRR